MFSDHLRPARKITARKILIIIGGMLIVGQLIAMVFVAGAQVEKAQSRQTMQANFQSAVATCVENNYGAALNKCASLKEPVVAPTAAVKSP